MPPSYYDDEALTPLVNDRSGNGSSIHSSKAQNSSIMTNRILVIISLVGLVVISLYFQVSEYQLKQQLATDEDKIHLLTQTVEAQGHVIQRFNESVTNSDVLKRLNLLEASLEKSQKDLQDELDRTVKDVDVKLEKTMTDLDETVKKAEAEISDQVETVKKDFEQYVIRTEDQFSMENSFMVYQLAGTFTLLSCLISMWHMTAHLRKLKQPVIQRKILAILWMSPIYAVTSWFSLVFPAAEGYLAIIKDGYEAYVIYTFLSFCIAVLGKGDRETVVDLLARRADHLTPPFRLFFCCKRDIYDSDRELAAAILLQCQVFAMQFVFFRPVTTIAKVVLKKYNYYGPWADGPNDWRAPQFYVTLIQNLSIFIAFTGLLKFYHAVDKDLEWCRPFAKFLCIKGVVFMTFWQGLAISILAAATDVGGSDAEEWALSAQNFLICLEMLLFSIAHFYCFPTEEWDENYRANFNKSKFGDSIALGDFVADLKLIMKGNKKKTKKKPSEPTVPEGDEENESHDATLVQDDLEEDGGNDDNASTTSDISSNTGTSDIEDPKRAIAFVVARTSDTDTEDVEAARQRILASGFLNDMLFLPSPRIDGSVTCGFAETEDEPCRQSSYGATNTANGDEEEVFQATEHTGLLTGGHSSSQSPALRPSIFTTIADMSEKKKNEDLPTSSSTS